MANAMKKPVKKPAKKLPSVVAKPMAKVTPSSPVTKAAIKQAGKPIAKSAAKPTPQKEPRSAVKVKPIIVKSPVKKEVAKDVKAAKVVKKTEHKASASATAKPKTSSEEQIKPVAKVISQETKGKTAKPTVIKEAKATEAKNHVSDKAQTAPLKVSVTTNKTDSKTVSKPAKSSANTEKPVEVQEIKSGSAPTVSQTTDAAVLASIDTSGYILPGVKVPGRRGRKPKEYQPENEEMAALNAVERAEMKAIDKAKAKDRKAKEKALLKDAFSADPEATAEELERRRQKLKTLIKLGKDRGYLTFAEINDHLPENVVDPEAIEGIIGTFNDMGVAVYEQAPDAEALLLSDNVVTVTSDDDEVEAAAEAALSTVDSDFGRTTDPVRMYMREMGTVELLTREGEIVIAKKIEEGLKDMIQAISACPVTIAEIISAAIRI
ncbi:MAG: RNA polymerase sigma factor region1.1 domain-containing protein, partial [Pseudomonadota bacterium]